MDVDMGMAEKAAADRRDPNQKSMELKGGRDELHVSHDPSFQSNLRPPATNHSFLFWHIHTFELLTNV